MAPGSNHEAQIAVLQNQVAVLERGQEETRKLMREQRQDTKEDLDEIKAALKPLADSFLRFKGFQGAVYAFVTLAAVGLGAGFKELLQWLSQAVKP